MMRTIAKRSLFLLAAIWFLSAALAPVSYAEYDDTNEHREARRTLWLISLKYQVGLQEVIAANPQIANPDLIYPGHEVYDPSCFPRSNG